MTKINFIPYQPIHQQNCLAVFDSNIDPGYFAPHEREDFITFLSNTAKDCHYLVGTLQKTVVACAGWQKTPEGIYLRWGMIHGDWHRQGLGQQLLNARLAHINQVDQQSNIYINTSNKAQGFYLKAGFTIVEIEPDGIAQGIDAVKMCLER